MSRIVKKMKIMQPGGTLSDYVPIGAEAENINVDGESVETKLGKKPYYYNTIADMKADIKLKAGDMAVTLGYYSINDGGGATYNIVNDESVDDGGSIHILSNELRAKLIIDTYVTPEQFGAYGDIVHDDTLAIQSLLDYCKNNNIVSNLCKNYLITSPINISGQYILINGEKCSITYNGNDSAIKINACIDSNIYLGKIIAENGNGIEFYTKDTSSQSTSGWCQYVNLSFVLIRALDKCIYFNRSSSNNGWINEIRINNGKLETGNYGIWADAKNLNAINNISISNVGIEGVTTGIYLANKCFMWNFNNCRYAESFTTLIETVGDIRQCVFNGSVLFPINKCNMSTSTSNFIINAPIGDTGSRVIAYNGCFYEGSFRPQIKDLEALNLNRTIYSDTVNYVMPEEIYTDYIIIGNNDTNLESIKLNKSFPTSQWGDNKFAINEFILYMNFSTARNLTIYDSSNNIVFNQGYNYTKAYLKFKFTTNVGWICEEMNVVPTI